MFKNKFVIIIGLSIITFALLILGAVTLHKDNSRVFSTDGYILSTGVETEEEDKNDNTYYFKANTKYKTNVDGDIVFDDKDSNSIIVDTNNFVHYSNGSIAFLQKGAIVNLKEITAPIISYYNVTDNNIVGYDNNGYVITTNTNETVSIESFVGRINYNKYIIASKDLTLKVPNKNEEISGDYFEVLFIKDGIVKIVNESNSFQVTAQGTYFYIGKDIAINLGDGKIYYNGEAKMLISQITINGDENIDLAEVKEDDNGGSGEGSGEGGEGSADGEGGEGGDGSGEGGDGSGSDSGGGDGTGDGSVVENAIVELVSASVTTTSIDIKLLLNNSSSVKGTLKAYITNISTNNDVDFTIDAKNTNVIDLNDGTFDISTSDSDNVNGTREFHLNPDTDYMVRVISEDGNSTNQYFQKIFRTKSLGISLEKIYATDSSLKYKINFDENSNVKGVYLNISGNGIGNRKRVSIDDDSYEVEFDGLKSNSNYSVYIDNINVSNNDNNITYANRYNISRIDTTLKKVPIQTGKVINVKTDVDNARFNIKLENLSDSDDSITGYTYEVLLNDEEGEVVYSVNKSVSDNNKDDARELVLNLSEIKEMVAGVSYRCRVLVNYNNNEMYRELLIDDGDVFSLRSLPSINWNTDGFDVGMYNIKGAITLIDSSCTIPIIGRQCSDINELYKVKDTSFTLKYYIVGEDEKTAKEIPFKFRYNDLGYNFNISGLLSNTNYVMKIYGSYYDDKNNYHENVAIGSSAFFSTHKSDNLNLIINNVGESNDTNVVNFGIKLDKGASKENYEEEITSVTMNLYSGSYNNSDKLIGTYTVTDRTKINDLFNNFDITNGLFTNVSKRNISGCDENKLCNKDALIVATNNSVSTLSNSYTMEIVDVKVGDDRLVVENPIYTYVLTSSYYLDARISSNSNYNYVTVDEIFKKDLTEEEYAKLKKNGISNLDDLLDDTVVGIKISNNLSDLYVNSAFSYEKAVLKYIIHNNKMNKDIKVIDIDMGNKYQPGEQVVWLDLTDTNDGFVRGYDYNIGYIIDFTIDSTGLNSDEDADVVTYDNAKFHKKVSIDRQLPIYNQYISNSTFDSVTYRYSMTDIDNALFDTNAYYTYSVNDEVIENNVNNFNFNIDGKFHDVIIPISDRVDYSWGYHKKNINGNNSGNVEMDNYTFDSEFKYDGNVSFEVINGNDNRLKLKLVDNDIHNRAVAYRVVLTSSGVTDYNRVFLASYLDKYGDVLEGDEDNRSRYIAIDYANISKFLKKNIKISLYAYYDSGLVGLNQDFSNGFIIKNIKDNKYLNIFNNGSQDSSSFRVDNDSKGINYLREPFAVDGNSIYIYNLFMGTNNYSNYLGTSYYLKDEEISGNIGVNFDLAYTNNGIVISNGKNNFSGYNMKVSNVSEIKGNASSYRFDSITPKISVNSSSTINSIKLKFNASGIYDNNQFIRNNKADNNIYIEVYSDPECNDKVRDVTSSLTISGSDSDGYSATIEDVLLDNLKSDSKYYFKVYAYMNNKYTRLYDASVVNTYESKVYEGKTLGGNEILSRIKFAVKPVSYNGEYSNKQISWILNFNNSENFKVRFELYKPDGEEFKAVNFDGTDGVNCNINANGNVSSGYVNGCYINVDKDDIGNIKGKEQVYSFGGNSFVFGGGFYKLVVYAIPYTNGNYVEDDKVVLYESDSLSSTGNVNIGGINYNISIPYLNEADIKYNELSSGYDNGYYIDFVPNIIDEFKVIKFGKYNISVRDDDGNDVSGCNIIVSSSKKGTGKCSLDVSSDEVNSKYRISNLDSDTLYTIILSYDILGNNKDNFYDKNKVNEYFYYTPSSTAGVRIGTINTQRLSNKSFGLTYSGSVNLSYIKRVDYTIQLVGDNSMHSGSINNDKSSIFTVSGNNVILNIDFSGDDSGFEIVKGQSYKINTKYYYDINKQPLSMTSFLEA